jgi:GNAT superfamily N-acetyltransferase
MSHEDPLLRSHWRFVPFGDRHVPIFAEWFNGLPANEGWTLPYIRRVTIDNPDYDPRLMFAVVVNGVPCGFLISTIAAHQGWISAFIVDPARRRRGIGTAMFDHVERAFAESGIAEVKVGWALPRYLLPGIDIHYTDAITFLDRRGYVTDRRARVNLEVALAGRDFDTSARERALAERGFLVRRAERADGEELQRLCESNGHDGWAIEVAMALEKDTPALFVAERAGAIAAFAAHSVAGPHHFGPMLTASDLRGLGLGSVLLKRCFQDWQRAGVTRCEIVWAGPIAFYARAVGATVDRAFWTFERELS